MVSISRYQCCQPGPIKYPCHINTCTYIVSLQCIPTSLLFWVCCATPDTLTFWWILAFLESKILILRRKLQLFPQNQLNLHSKHQKLKYLLSLHNCWVNRLIQVACMTSHFFTNIVNVIMNNQRSNIGHIMKQHSCMSIFPPHMNFLHPTVTEIWHRQALKGHGY